MLSAADCVRLGGAASYVRVRYWNKSLEAGINLEAQSYVNGRKVVGDMSSRLNKNAILSIGFSAMLIFAVFPKPSENLCLNVLFV